MISNPATWFITGNDRLQFNYEGGNKVFHFSPYDNGLSKYLNCNIILFANDEKHGLSILTDMFNFAINCKAKYITHQQHTKSVHWEDFVDKAKNDFSEFNGYIEAIKNNKVKLTEAPNNQVYIVGWASNDVI